VLILAALVAALAFATAESVAGPSAIEGDLAIRLAQELGGEDPHEDEFCDLTEQKECDVLANEAGKANNLQSGCNSSQSTGCTPPVCENRSCTTSCSGHPDVIFVTCGDIHYWACVTHTIDCGVWRLGNCPKTINSTADPSCTFGLRYECVWGSCQPYGNDQLCGTYEVCV
jgi:hypothetical protein